MLQCLSHKTSSLSPPPETQTTENHNSQAPSPIGGSQISRTVSLTQEYNLEVQNICFLNIWSQIQIQEEVEVVQVEIVEEEREREILDPDKKRVEEALGRAKPSTLTRLASTYFENSEHIHDICLRLHRSVHRARYLYAPLHNLLNNLPLETESLTDSQYNDAYEIFLQFDSLDNPFPIPQSHNFNEIRLRLSKLKEPLDRRLRKSRLRLRYLHRATTGSALCLITTTFGLAISAVVIASHALVALVAASPLLITYHPFNFSKKEVAQMAKLDAAVQGTRVLKTHLDTIDCLVSRLHDAVEDDKVLIRFGLVREGEKYAIQVAAKQLKNNYGKFVEQLNSLEQHICFCLANVNWARSQLLEKIHLHP